MITIPKRGISILRGLAIILAISGVIDMLLEIDIPSPLFGIVCFCMGIALFLLTYATRSKKQIEKGVD